MLRTMSVVGLLVMLGACDGSSAAAPAAAETTDTVEGAESSHDQVYRCPMQCKQEGEDKPYEQAEPGKCPVCGMDLEKQ